jgi:hypothetical protein
MRWSNEEELLSRNKEIERLQSEILRLNKQREDSLSSQRRDLSQVFENILRENEEKFAIKEKEIGEQVNMLNDRFERLFTENTRIKKESHEMRINNDKMREEMSRKDDLMRQIQWQMEDLRATSTHSEDELRRKLHSVEVDLAVAKETTSFETSDLLKRLDAVSAYKPIIKQHIFRKVLFLFHLFLLFIYFYFLNYIYFFFYFF